MNIFEDIKSMHQHYGIRNAVVKMNTEQRKKFMDFRIQLLAEELHELLQAKKNADAEETVDALIDIIVVAAGTLDLHGVDGESAWREVLTANMKKEAGINYSRPNPHGLPDLRKPEGWTAPNHHGNHGLFYKEADYEI